MPSGPAYAVIDRHPTRDHFSISDAWILRGKRVGFSLGEIREMIDLYDIGDGRQVQKATTIARCRERMALLQSQKHDIDAAITELADFVTLLETNGAQGRLKD